MTFPLMESFRFVCFPFECSTFCIVIVSILPFVHPSLLCLRPPTVLSTGGTHLKVSILWFILSLVALYTHADSLGETHMVEWP